MARIKYLQRTHDSLPGDEKTVNDQCAKVLVLLGKAEFITDRRTCGSGSKNKKIKRGLDDVEFFEAKR